MTALFHLPVASNTSAAVIPASECTGGCQVGPHWLSWLEIEHIKQFTANKFMNLGQFMKFEKNQINMQNSMPQPSK
jgi:hypothetical protein